MQGVIAIPTSDELVGTGAHGRGPTPAASAVGLW